MILPEADDRIQTTIGWQLLVFTSLRDPSSRPLRDHAHTDSLARDAVDRFHVPVFVSPGQWLPASSARLYSRRILTLHHLGLSAHVQAALQHNRPPEVSSARRDAPAGYSCLGLLASLHPALESTCWAAYMD